MTDKKDFLSQFSGPDKKPDSFKEEERVPIVKEKKPVKPQYIIIPAVVLLALAVASYFLFFAPKIVMKDFVGQPKTEISSFVRQQQIDATGIVFREAYDFDIEKDHVVSQSVEAGKKIGKNAKIDFVISLGADPDEKISFPDIRNMDREDIDSWIKKNKLQKTKITTSYNENVPAGEVISYEVKGDEADFTRGTTLNISISKGPAPAGTIQISDFVKKSYYEAETWAKQNKVEIIKNEAYSNTIDAGLIISQYPSSGTMKTGDTFSVTVSKGKGISIPDFTRMSENDLNAWERKNNVSVIRDSKYADSDRYVISQSPSAGSMVAQGESISVVTNLGNGFYMAEEGLSTNMTASQFIDQINRIRPKGLDIFAGSWASPDGVYSYEKHKGEIVSITCSDYSTREILACELKLPLDARFDLVVSKGILYDIDLSGVRSGSGYSTIKLSDLLSSKPFVSFFVKTTGDTCELFVNDKKVTSDAVTLVEGDYIELR